VVSARILIKGEKVQEIGYRIFLLEKALESNIEKIHIRNLDKNKVDLLISDDEDKIRNFYGVVQKERPSGAIIKDVRREPYEGKIPIPSIDRYFQFLTLEQLSKGREEVLKLPRFVSEALGIVASAVKGIDEKLGNLTDRFGIFRESAKRMDNRLAGIDKKLETLPDRIAKAINSEAKKQQ